MIIIGIFLHFSISISLAFVLSPAHIRRPFVKKKIMRVSYVTFYACSIIIFFSFAHLINDVTTKRAYKNVVEALSQYSMDQAISSDKTQIAEYDWSQTQMIQNVIVIWLDANSNENNTDCQNTINRLRRVVNTVNTFTNSEECIQFLKEVTDEKVCMITSGTLGQQIIPRAHDLCQVDSIFIFCQHKEYHEGWANDWLKIKGVFTKIESICDALKQTARQCQQNAISISIMGGSDNIVEKNGDRLDPSFMYTQIMKEIFLTINFEPKHIDEFIQYCRETLAHDEKQLKYVSQLACQYREHTPIWWYTRECFLYPMLNHALRTMDANLMVKLGFFISDLHRQIEQLHQEQLGSDSFKQCFTVYRGQRMDKEAFKKMVANKGGLISFNSFLSTSKNRLISLHFAQHVLKEDQMVGVLFVMNIDPVRSSTPFASVVDVGYFGKKEDEVLFSMNIVFRIEEITLIDDNPRLVQVQLSLASGKDNDLRQLIDHIREETFPNFEGWYRLGLVLYKIGEPLKAQQIYETLLAKDADERTKASIFGQIGLIKQELAEYTEAIAYYEKSIELKEKYVSLNDLGLVNSYNNIGLAYESIGEHEKALWFHEKALTIQQQSLPSTHPHLATSYINIGNVYSSMGDYPKALSSDKKALEIQQQSLPSTHPHLGKSYNNIGIVYQNMGDYSKALSSYEKALSIKQQSLPSTHPDLALTYYNIGFAHEKMRNYAKAYWYLELAVTIGQHSLPENHPHLQTWRNNLTDVKKKL